MTATLFSTCLNGERFVVFNAEATFDEARVICQDRGGDIGPVRGESEFDLVGDLIRATGLVEVNDQDDVEERFFFGLTVEGVATGDPLDFTFTASPEDDTGLDFYHVDVGEFPWRSGQPNNAFNSQDCAAYLFRSADVFVDTIDGEIEDISCETTANVICREPCTEVVTDVEVEGQGFRIVHDSDFEDVYTADQIEELCNTVGGISPATIRSANQFNGIREVIAENSGFEFNVGLRAGFIIGLKVPEDERATRINEDTTAFKFFDVDDVEGLDFFNGDTGVFPWVQNQPNNNGNNQHCTRIDFEFESQDEIDNFDAAVDEDQGIVDTECSLLSVGFICDADVVNQDQDENALVQLAVLSLLSSVGCMLFILIALFVFEKRRIKSIEKAFISKKSQFDESFGVAPLILKTPNVKSNVDSESDVAVRSMLKQETIASDTQTVESSESGARVRSTDAVIEGEVTDLL